MVKIVKMTINKNMLFSYKIIINNLFEELNERWLN